MTRNTDARPRGVLLTLLDTDAILAELPPSEDGRKPSLGFTPYAYAEAPDGDVYVICSEGVGWLVPNDGLELDIYLNLPGFIAVFPEWRVTLSPTEVREYATGETVDLADHVRQFGARLESNFWGWYRRLSGGK